MAAAPTAPEPWLSDCRTLSDAVGRMSDAVGRMSDCRMSELSDQCRSTVGRCRMLSDRV